MLRVVLSLVLVLAAAVTAQAQPMRQLPQRGLGGYTPSSTRGYGGHNCNPIYVFPGYNYNRNNRPIVYYGNSWYSQQPSFYSQAYRGQTSTVTTGNNRAYNTKPTEPLTIENPYFKK